MSAQRTGRRAEMPYYRQVGEVPRKRHTQFRKPDGGLYAEELMGVRRASPPTRRCSTTGTCRRRSSTAEVHETRRRRSTANQPLLPRHLRTHKLDAGPADAVTGPPGCCWPTTTSGSRTRWPTGRPRSTATRSATSASTSSPAPPRSRPSSARSRSARATTSIMPTSMIHRWVPTGDGPLRTAGHRGERAHRPAEALPVRQRGQFLEHSPYCERDLRGPAEPLLVERVRRGGAGPAPHRDDPA